MNHQYTLCISKNKTRMINSRKMSYFTEITSKGYMRTVVKNSGKISEVTEIQYSDNFPIMTISLKRRQVYFSKYKSP